MPLLQTAGQSYRRPHSHMPGHAVRTLALLAVLLLPWPVHAQTPDTRLAVTYGRLPLIFEANTGQTDPAVKFLSRGRGYTLFLTPTEAVLALIKAPGDGTVLRMSLVGAQPSPRIVGLEELPGKVNYFIGNDPAKWRTNIPTYAKVKYGGVYPGVDLVYYGSQRQLEYDFVVAPGANPDAITLAFDGPDKLEVDAQGDLILRTSSGEVRLKKPLVYQEVDGQRKPIARDYILKSNNQVGFQVAAYDVAMPLIIDPALVYSTYLGGGGTDVGNGIAVESSSSGCSGGCAYVTGETISINFPVKPVPGAFQPALSGKGASSDAFVTKVNTNVSGSASLVYSTYLGGGSGPDKGLGIAVDPSGNAYVTGQAFSSSFPAPRVKAGSLGVSDAFVVKLNNTGSALPFGILLGGNGLDAGRAIALAPGGIVYVTGQTLSTNFPTTVSSPTTLAALQTALGDSTGDAFLTKIDTTKPSDLTSIIFSTYLGGNGTDDGRGVAVDGAGNAYVTGTTSSTNFPGTTLAGVFDSSLGGPSDAFVTKVSTTGAAVIAYSTYLGGSCADQGQAIAVDGSGNAYVTGQTFSTDFPGAAPFGFQPTLGEPGITCGASGDAFVAKLNPAGSALLYSTYAGGGGVDQGLGIAVDGSGNAYVTGTTSSTNFPVTPATALDITLNGSSDAFVTRVNTLIFGPGSLAYSTYLGGSAAEQANGLALDTGGNVYVTGQTSSTDFLTSDPPTTSGFQSCLGSGLGGTCLTTDTDAFVAKIAGLAKTADLAVTKTAPTVNIGNSLTYTATVTNGGPDSATGIVLTDTLPPGVTFVSATPNQGSGCGGTTTITCNLGTLVSGASATVTIKVTATTPGQVTNTAKVAAIEFDPNAANNTSSLTTNVTVPTTLVLNSVSPTSVLLGSAGPVTFQATLTRNDGGAGVVGATIAFTVDGGSAGTAATNASGVATFSFNPSTLGPGSHTVRASFAGQTISGITFNISTSDTLALDVSVNTTLVLNSVNPNSVLLGSAGPVTFQATLTRNDGGAGVVGATIAFTVDGGSVGTAATNASGVATFSFNPSTLGPGSHTVRASFAGQTISGITFNISTSGTLPLDVTIPTTLVLNFVSVGSSGITYTATLTRNDTTAGLVGATITLTVGGNPVASASTVTGGVATFTFNPSGLAPGDFTVQASFAQSNFGGITFLASQSNILAIHVPTVTTLSPNIFLQGQTADVTITGTDYQPGATADFGPGTKVNSVTFVDAARLVANVSVLASAFPNPCPANSTTCFVTNSVRVLNPDGGSGAFLNSHALVQDSDGDGVADGVIYSSSNFGIVAPLDFGPLTTIVPSKFLTGPVHDNCPLVVNQSQIDTDLDGIGDACDRCPLIPGTVGCGNDVLITVERLTDPVFPFGDLYVKATLTHNPILSLGNYFFFPARQDNIYVNVVDITNLGNPIVLLRRLPEWAANVIPDDLRFNSGSPVTTSVAINLGGLYPEGLPPGHTLKITAVHQSLVRVEDPQQLCPADTPGCSPPPLLQVTTGTAETPPFSVRPDSVPTILTEAQVNPTVWDVTWALGATGVVDVFIGNLGIDVGQIVVSTVLLNGLASPTTSEILLSFPGFVGRVLHLRFTKVDAITSLRALVGRLSNNDQETIQVTGQLTDTGLSTGTVIARFRASATITVRDETQTISQIDALINLVNILSISPSTQQAFLAKLAAARTSVVEGNIPDACTKIQDFINLTNAQTGKGVTAADAATLIAAANQIKVSLGCP